MEEEVFIENPKGLKLAAVINFPDKNKQYPAIIILHGFTGYKEEAHLEELAKTLANNGFTAIRFDCSGSGESEGTFEKDYLVSNYLDDIKSVFNYVRNLKFVNKSKIGIVGHSMGGMLSVIFAAMHPEIKICVPISPTTTMTAGNWIKEVIGEWRETGWFDKELSRDGSQIRIPFSFIEDANKFDAVNYVSKLHCSLLMIVGLTDDTVSPEDSKKIFKIANKPKELIEIKGMGHDYKKHPKVIKIVNEKILNFIRKYL